MSKRFLIQACAASALLTLSPAAGAQTNTADPALNAATDPMATNTTDPLATNTMGTDPLATDPMATGTAADPLATDPMINATPQEEDNDFPWGLLGLLGLAGLLGLKRRDRDEIYVDRTGTGGPTNRM